MLVSRFLPALFIFLLFGCNESAWQLKSNLLSVCDIFDENPSWLNDLESAERKWGISSGFLLATVYQESRFYADAKPKSSDAFGFAQAREGTWKDFLENTGFIVSARDNFYAAVNFIGWYTAQSIKMLKINTNDYKSLYLAYHEGRKGFANKTFLDKEKAWLLQVSGQVDMLARHYARDIKNCYLF